jgi:hypothetical protein
MQDDIPEFTAAGLKWAVLVMTGIQVGWTRDGSARRSAGDWAGFLDRPTSSGGAHSSSPIAER